MALHAKVSQMGVDCVCVCGAVVVLQLITTVAGMAGCVAHLEGCGTPYMRRAESLQIQNQNLRMGCTGVSLWV